MQDFSYNSGMKDSVRERLIVEAERSGQSLAALSKKIGRNHAYLQQFVKRGIPAELPERARHALANVLRIDESTLRGDSVRNLDDAGQVERPATGYRAPPEIFGERDLKVFAAVEAGSGAMVVSTEPIELVPRPWYLREVKDGFAVLVVGESMLPVYEPGDLVIVNPRLPPMRGKDMIFVSGEKEGEFTATIKRLLRWTDKHWHVCQFNPTGGQQKNFTLSKADWPKALRVVGRYSGG